MNEVFSKGEDCAWLAQELKNKMGGYVSFNKFGIENSVLTGVYIKSGISKGPFYEKEDVRFHIKFCKNEFLRIQIETGLNSSDDIALAMQELIKALETIKQENKFIKLPLAIYKVDGALTSEYAFKNKKLTVKALKNDTMFDDGHIENLNFLRNCYNCAYYAHHYTQVTIKKVTLYCEKGHYDVMPEENKECTKHKFLNGEMPDIKALCEDICDNNK